MRKDWKMWSVYINAHHFSNWAVGLDYYHEYSYMPQEIIARVFQVNLLLFNITFTRWSRGEVFPGI
jgi:hypothetical protein